MPQNLAVAAVSGGLLCGPDIVAHFQKSARAAPNTISTGVGAICSGFGIMSRKKMLSTRIIEPINFQVNRRFGCFRGLEQTKKSKLF